MGLSPTKPLRDGDHAQPPREALPSPLKSCEGLSWVPQCWHCRHWGHWAAIPAMNAQVRGPSSFLGFVSTFISFLQDNISSNLLQLFRTPCPSHARQLPGTGTFQGSLAPSKVPVVRDTSSHIPLSSNIPLPGGYASLPQLFTTIPTIFHHHLSF